MPDDPQTPSEMEALIAAQLGELSNAGLADQIQMLLTAPVRKTLHWEYGDNEPYDAWLFADLGERDVWAAYCAHGHGAFGSPWGMVSKNDDYFGMDCGWFPDLKSLLLDWFA